MLLTILLTCLIGCSGNDGGSTESSQNVISCNPEQITASDAGGSYTVSVTSDGEWTAYTDAAWIKTTVTGSTDKKGTVTVIVEPNNEATTRKGVVTVKSGTNRKAIEVTQSPSMVCTPAELYSSSAGETLEVTVTATADWTITTSDSWITVEKVSATKATVKTTANSLTTSRNGSVTVADGTKQITIPVRQESVSDPSINVPEGYRLVWNDEFSGTLSNDWTHEVKGAGWVNNELQSYVNGSVAGKRVTEINDGKLSINCFKSGSSIYSGRIYAKVNTGWTYGYMEARMMLPKGKGTWPAFWMMPCNNDFNTNPWPHCGEIDIMEEVGADPGDVSSTIHCTKYNNSGTAIEHGSTYLADAESEYHVYACEWTPTFLRFLVDGKQILNYMNDGTGIDAWPFDQPFYIILNLAWGGDWGGYKGVDESALPVTMKVDYVRVFQKK